MLVPACRNPVLTCPVYILLLTLLQWALRAGRMVLEQFLLKSIPCPAAVLNGVNNLSQNTAVAFIHCANKVKVLKVY